MIFSILVSLCASWAVAAQPSHKGSDSPELNATWSLFQQESPAIADVFPVISMRLSPGFIEDRAIDMPGLNPVFLIGNDSLSRNWLRANKSLLQRLKATGLVVNAASPDSVNELSVLVDGLLLLPVTGDDLARLLDLEHYPVLITPTYLEQGL
ncbi:integrating conjugative element protein (TIGR03765 family) [Azomonas agilis]|uniref:Integrating conjugative element protein (TIGR03765 family) n=2 Tax=Azomonas agilis TaxID=116849 RepID=A0A562IZA9_9GAMM|nr:integrating conjugative element protein (TIGR03765 family) [Azomonas agilis]